MTAMAAAYVQVAEAQITTSSVSGSVTTENGQAVSGAAVTITHTPSGTRSSDVTDANGNFSARGLRVGGPYTVKVVASGYPDVEVTDIYVTLDDTFNLPVVLSQPEDTAVLQTIVITAAQLGTGTLDTGLSTSLSLEKLGQVVSIDRDIADAAALDPFASVNIQSGGAKELSIAGVNNRFNSITIDGIAINDSFGLNANGYPTQRSPIPFEAIENLDVQTAPYDVEFNGFTGGTINAVTKSGTNEFHGSLYGFYTDDRLLGDSIRGDEISSDFEEKTWGFTVGGPIIKDKLFFFAAYDKFEATQLLRSGPAGSGAINEFDDITSEDVATVGQFVSDTWGFDIGSYSGIDPVEDEKMLGKIDWNITDNQRATFTYIRTEGNQINEQTGNNFLAGSPVLGAPSAWYNRSETINVYTGQWFSDWTDNFSTEFKVGYMDQATGQDSLGGAEFPSMAVQLNTEDDVDGDDINGDNAWFVWGPDRFRHGNELDQEFLTLKGKATWVLGDHTLKGGVEYFQADVNNLFAQNSEGSYAFDSLDDLYALTASGLLYNNAITNDENDLRAVWGYNVTSLYVQDEWDILDTLTVLGGLRYEFYGQDGSIRENQNFIDRFGYSNTKGYEDLDGVFSPRIAFKWDAMDNLRIRGGLGQFSGGTPNVWISNSFSNDGVISDSSNAFGVVNVPVTPDAATGQYIPSDVLDALASNAPDGSVNALDPSFQVPKTIRANLGAVYTADFGVTNDWNFSVDFLWNSLKDAPYWYDARCEVVNGGIDGRPVYDCSGAPEAIVVGSVDKGSSFLWALSVDKSFDNGIDLFASYTNTDAEDIGMGTSSTATSNYSDSARYDLQVPVAGTSNFQVEHQFKLRLAYEHEFVENYPTTVSMFMTRRSGQPYSYTFAENNACVFDIQGGRCPRESRVDDAGHLLYVPTGADDPLFSAASFGGDADAQAAFFDYINSSELAQYKGGVAERNGDNSRWSTKVDLRFQQQFPGIRKNDRTILFVDLENIGNMIDDEWGVIERTRYEYERAVVSAQIENGQFVYDNLNSEDRINNTEILTNSLWQVQLGLKYEF